MKLSTTHISHSLKYAIWGEIVLFSSKKIIALPFRGTLYTSGINNKYRKIHRDN